MLNLDDATIDNPASYAVEECPMCTHSAFAISFVDELLFCLNCGTPSSFEEIILDSEGAARVNAVSTGVVQ